MKSPTMPGHGQAELESEDSKPKSETSGEHGPKRNNQHDDMVDRRMN